MARLDQPLRTAVIGGFALLVLGLGAGVGRVHAQEVFSSHDDSIDEPDTGEGGRTGTQGVVGNPFCPPPVIVINGRQTHPRNWSCRTGGDNGPGRPMVIGPGANACRPFGKGGYDYCQNPEGTRLPAGCTCAGWGRADSSTRTPRGHPTGPEGGAALRYVNRSRDPGVPGAMHPNVAGRSSFGGWRKSTTTDNQRASKTLKKIADERNKDYRAQINRGLAETHNKLNGRRVVEPFVADSNHSHATGRNGSQAFGGSNIGSGGFARSRVNSAVTARGTGGNTTHRTGRGAVRVPTIIH